MISNDRSKYLSSAEWLSALRQDEAWLLQEKRLQCSDSAAADALRKQAAERMGDDTVAAFWDIYNHHVEKTIQEAWDTGMSLVKLKIQAIGLLTLEWLEGHGCGYRQVPEKLQTEEAEALLQKLVDHGYLTASWQPLNLSGTERGLIAQSINDHLNLTDVWQVFGQLWGDKPETLRGYFNKALEQKKSLEFQSKLKKVLR